MNKEKVRKLAEKLALLGGRADENELILLGWLEQNQPEPVVVGLSDLQIDELHDAIHYNESENTGEYLPYSGVIREYIKTQTFAQVEPIKVPVGLSDKQVEDLASDLALASDGLCAFYEQELKKWLENQTSSKPEVKEALVGLSDELVERLNNIALTYFDNLGVTNVFDADTGDSELSIVPDFKAYLETQTFAQPVEFSNVELADAYQSLCEDMNNLSNELEQLKSQQFQPDWDNAPSWANWLAQDENYEPFYYENEPFKVKKMWTALGNKERCFNKAWQQTLQQRPKPTPQVEVGQVWEALNMKFTVNQYVLSGRDYEVICVSDSGFEYKGTLSDFLAKFERVQP